MPVAGVLGALVLLVCCTLIAQALGHRNAKRRRLEFLDRTCFDDRDTLVRFRRIIGR